MPLDDRDLIELRDWLWAAMVRDADAPIDPLTLWQPLYADTIAAVLKRGTSEDWARLSALLREKQPLHPMLLPALAEALEARGRNKRAGPRPRLSPIEALEAARSVRYLRRTGQSRDGAVAAVAERLGVSESTVMRAARVHNRRRF